MPRHYRYSLFWRKGVISVHTSLKAGGSLDGRANNSVTSPMLNWIKFYLACTRRLKWRIKRWNFMFKFQLISEKSAKNEEATFRLTLYICISVLTLFWRYPTQRIQNTHKYQTNYHTVVDHTSRPKPEAFKFPKHLPSTASGLNYNSFPFISWPI